MPAAIPEPNKQNTASDGQSALAGELLGADSQVSEAMTGPQTAVSAVPPEANERVTGGSSQSPERGSGVEAPASSRPATPANHRYSTPHSRPTSPVPSLRNLESCRPSSSQRPDSPSEPSKTVSEKGPSSPRANSPFLQKAQSFGRSNVSARRVTSMLVEKRAPSGLRAEYEEDQISPRAFEVKPLADTDGLCAVLYHYLWRKTSKGKGCPGLNLPDTIVYRYRQPTHWFFTSVHDGQVRGATVGSSSSIRNLLLKSVDRLRVSEG